MGRAPAEPTYGPRQWARVAVPTVEDRSGDGSTAWCFGFNGTPEEAACLRSLSKCQGRRGVEKALDIRYQLLADPPLCWIDGGKALGLWAGRDDLPSWPDLRRELDGQPMAGS